MKKVTLKLLIFAVFFCNLLNLTVLAQDESEGIIQNFLNLVSNKKYPEAYSQLSSRIKEEVSFSEFSEQAKDIKKIKFLSLNAIESSSNLKKFKLKAWVALIYREKYYTALYEGTAILNKFKDKWYVFSVELKPVAQKEIDKKIYFGI